MLITFEHLGMLRWAWMKFIFILSPYINNRVKSDKEITEVRKPKFQY